MTHISHELVRQNLLSQLDAAYPLALPIQTLQQGLSVAGLQLTEEQLLKELAYLLDKSFLTSLHSELCPCNMRYKISTKGIDFLDNESRNISNF